MKAIIIEDEKLSRLTLIKQLEKYCPEVDIVGTGANGMEAIQLLQIHHPEVVFLDIEMPVMDGFEFIQNLNEIDFEIIFTTAYDKFALKAFEVSAIDYLLKPIESEKLIKAVNKVKDRKIQQTTKVQMDFMLTNLKTQNDSFAKLAIPSMDGLEFVDMDDIIRCEAQKNYTYIYSSDGQKFIFSRTLKDIESMLPAKHFLRVHQSHLINLNSIKKYVKGNGGELIMKDGSIVQVSRLKKSHLLSKILPS